MHVAVTGRSSDRGDVGGVEIPDRVPRQQPQIIGTRCPGAGTNLFQVVDDRADRQPQRVLQRKPVCREQDKGDAEAHRVASDLGIVTQRVQAACRVSATSTKTPASGNIGRLTGTMSTGSGGPPGDGRNKGAVTIIDFPVFASAMDCPPPWLRVAGMTRWKPEDAWLGRNGGNGLGCRFDLNQRRNRPGVSYAVVRSIVGARHEPRNVGDRSPSESAEVAARRDGAGGLQADARARSAQSLVTDAQSRLLGIFTGRDAVRVLAQGKDPATKPQARDDEAAGQHAAALHCDRCVAPDARRRIPPRAGGARRRS